MSIKFGETLFKNAEKLVQQVLAENESSRGNDMDLIFSVWEKQGFNLVDSQLEEGYRDNFRRTTNE